MSYDDSCRTKLPSSSEVAWKAESESPNFQIKFNRLDNLHWSTYKTETYVTRVFEFVDEGCLFIISFALDRSHRWQQKAVTRRASQPVSIIHDARHHLDTMEIITSLSSRFARFYGHYPPALFQLVGILLWSDHLRLHRRFLFLSSSILLRWLWDFGGVWGGLGSIARENDRKTTFHLITEKRSYE